MAKTANERVFNARTYMELAIEEMHKSVNEPRPDGKVPPKVGAILLFPNGKVVRAHRGELREGDHAEYTLIERKLPHEKLDDCILFTTLEPCVERNPPKVACCRRTSNARIKTVYVGITDPDPTVNGKGIAHLEKNGVRVVIFDRDFQKIIESENEDFLRQAIERKQKSNEDDLTPSIEKPVEGASFGEFSAGALQKFISSAKLPYKIDDPQFVKYLTDLGVLGIDKASNQTQPTGIGILLFAPNPRLIFKQAVLKCSVSYGNGEIETKDFDQPLVLLPDLIEEWLRKVLPSSKDTSSFKRQNIPAFPLEVLREAIINAIVHRDYTIAGVKASLQIDANSITVKSPGALMASISLEQLNSYKAPSISRNPILAYVFNLMGYVEESGYGMESLRSLNEKYGLPLPEYAFDEPFLSLVFPRSMDVLKVVSHNPGLSNLSLDELDGYEFIKLREKIKRTDYELRFKYERKKAERHLSKMVDERLIARKGSGPGTYYEIIVT